MTSAGTQIRPHSLRKFFKTQMRLRGVNSDYVDYMTGHVVDTYHDIQSKGVEFLRNIYSKAGVSVGRQTRLGMLDVLKEFARGLHTQLQQVSAATKSTDATVRGRSRYSLQTSRIDVESTLTWWARPPLAPTSCVGGECSDGTLFFAEPHEHLSHYPAYPTAQDHAQ